MKLKEFLEKLNKLAEENPKALDCDVVCSIDDEGNGYNKIHFDPAIGVMDDEGEFLSESFYEEEYDESPDVNAVCVN